MSVCICTLCVRSTCLTSYKLYVFIFVRRISFQKYLSCTHMISIDLMGCTVVLLWFRWNVSLKTYFLIPRNSYSHKPHFFPPRPHIYFLYRMFACLFMFIFELLPLLSFEYLSNFPWWMKWKFSNIYYIFRYTLGLLGLVNFAKWKIYFRIFPKVIFLLPVYILPGINFFDMFEALVLFNIFISHDLVKQMIPSTEKKWTNINIEWVFVCMKNRIYTKFRLLHNINSRCLAHCGSLKRLQIEK